MATTPARRIVLTGATRGLGRALTEQFIALGHRVFGCSRSSADIRELRRRFPVPNRFEVVDVTDAPAVERWAAQVLTWGEAPDLLLNNAAIINRNAPLWEIPADEFDLLVDINVKGVANVIRAFVPAMIARGRGVIVNFSSGWGRSTSPDVAPYCASKFAIEGLTKSLAQELPAGLAAVPLNPGVIDTDMLRVSFGEQAGAYISPAAWSEKAAPLLLRLGPADNGKSLSVPG
jgi:NAD(P)-dependent dehydrogenase (short-subunit alcohol dehydrogenase family)